MDANLDFARNGIAYAQIALQASDKALARVYLEAALDWARYTDNRLIRAHIVNCIDKVNRIP